MNITLEDLADFASSQPPSEWVDTLSKDDCPLCQFARASWGFVHVRSTFDMVAAYSGPDEMSRLSKLMPVDSRYRYVLSMPPVPAKVTWGGLSDAIRSHLIAPPDPS